MFCMWEARVWTRFFVWLEASVVFLVLVWCVDILKCLWWRVPLGFECVEVCWDLLVICQSKVNCSSQVCWRQVNLQVLWLQKKGEDDEFDGCLGCGNDKIWTDSWSDQRKTCQSQRWIQDCEQRNWLGWYHCWEINLLDQRIWYYIWTI